MSQERECSASALPFPISDTPCLYLLRDRMRSLPDSESHEQDPDEDERPARQKNDERHLARRRGEDDENREKGEKADRLGERREVLHRREDVLHQADDPLPDVARGRAEKAEDLREQVR